MNCVLHYVNLNPEMERAWQPYLTKFKNVFAHTDDLMNWKDNKVFVSLANSQLFFDGGSDKVYQKIFPNVDNIMKKAMQQYNFKDELGCFFLPVGTVFLKEMSDTKYLIACPTMFLPQDISTTRNVYYCTKLLLELLDKNPHINEIVMSSMGTGYGKMSFENSAKQTFEAIRDHYDKCITLDYVGNTRQDLVCNPQVKFLQPKYYCNSRFIPIKEKDIINIT
jgi:O-acetyl-ADP-ribose deacetylase (regulator of RNase III)